MSILYPIEWYRKSYRKTAAQWDREIAATAVGLARNDNDRGCVVCPNCRGERSIAPVHSHYRNPRWVEHVWLCQGCGHEWTTSLQVPS